MKHLNLSLTLVLCSIFYASLFSQNASITIINKTDRHLNVKVMHGATEKKAILYKTDSVSPKGTVVFDVFETGLYFTKTRGILYDKKNPVKNDTFYTKDSPIKLVSDKKLGYDKLTIEFKEKKSMTNNTISINRKEYDH